MTTAFGRCRPSHRGPAVPPATRAAARRPLATLRRREQRPVVVMDVRADFAPEDRRSFPCTTHGAQVRIFAQNGTCGGHIHTRPPPPSVQRPDPFAVRFINRLVSHSPPRPVHDVKRLGTLFQEQRVTGARFSFFLLLFYHVIRFIPVFFFFRLVKIESRPVGQDFARLSNLATGIPIALVRNSFYNIEI